MARRPEPTLIAPAELALRRRAARRVAWLLGAAALLLYVVGFLVSR